MFVLKPLCTVAVTVLLLMISSTSGLKLAGSRNGNASPSPSPGMAEGVACAKVDTNFCVPGYKFSSKEIDDCCKDDACMICHPNGCDQCCDGYFKPDYDAPCIRCKDYDPKAKMCTDFIGSQQCKKDGWSVQDYTYKYKNNSYKMKKCQKD